MIYVLLKNNIIEHCVAVNSILDLIEYYPEHQILEQVGQENINWVYDGVDFYPPE